MSRIARNVAAVIAGLVAGSVVNMGLVNVGMVVVPIPEGADISTMEGVRASMKLMTPANFVFPWLAHALGTLAGAFVAAKLAASRPLACALIIGVFFLSGGITMAAVAGSPTWFIAADMFLAYLPMAYSERDWRREEAVTPTAARRRIDNLELG